MAEKPETVGDALALSSETQRLLKRAEEVLQILTDAGVKKPAVLGTLIDPTVKIRDTLEKEVEELEQLAKALPDICSDV